MKNSTFLLDLRPRVRDNELFPTVILITSAILLALHRNLGSVDFALREFHILGTSGAVYYMFIMAGILLGLIPAAILRWVFHEKLSAYGLCLGDWKTGLKIIGILFPIIALALLLPSSQTAEMRSYYPLDITASTSTETFIQHELARIVFFYIAWEFFFRGFMLFGLKQSMGDWMAICIQTIPQCLWHIGCPSGELFSSIAGGILFGMMAIKTRSILWPFILHVLIGVTMDVFIVLT